MPQEKIKESEISELESVTDIELPPECEVIFFNDDYTTMDFVIKVLIEVFNKNQDEAEKLMLTVHKEGSAIVGIYTYDIAVTKTKIALDMAKSKGFPLRIEVK